MMIPNPERHVNIDRCPDCAEQYFIANDIRANHKCEPDGYQSPTLCAAEVVTSVFCQNEGIFRVFWSPNPFSYVDVCIIHLGWATDMGPIHKVENTGVKL